MELSVENTDIPMQSHLRIITGFDGSSPHSYEGVRQEAEDTFTLYPSWRPSEGISEEAKGGGSRFGVTVANGGDDVVPAKLRLDWEDAERRRLPCHDFVFIRGPGDDDWIMVTGYIDGEEPVSHFSFGARPGNTEVFVCPRYNYQDNEDFIAALDSPHADCRLYGESEEGRHLWQVVLADLTIPDSGKKPVMVVARNHAYESAGSYCVDGMIRWLLSDDTLASFYLAKYVFHFLPMTNPDGVHNGMSRLTAPKGADMNRLHTVPDKAHAALKVVHDEVKPWLHLNIHNWMSKVRDGLLCLDSDLAAGIQHFMPPEIEFGKRWFVETWAEYLKGHPDGVIPKTGYSWKDYCMHEFGTRGVTFEFPWFARTGASMRRTGVKALKATLMAVQE